MNFVVQMVLVFEMQPNYFLIFPPPFTVNITLMSKNGLVQKLFNPVREAYPLMQLTTAVCFLSTFIFTTVGPSSAKKRWT